MAYKHSILIVEDDKTLGESLAEYLKSKSYDCLLTSTFQQAIETFEDRIDDISIILMDINLPDGNGIDLAKKMRNRNPSCVLFFLSALNDPNTRLQGLEIGAHDYITKPFELKELTLRLDRILKAQSEITQLPKVIAHGPLKIYFSQFQVIDADGNELTLSQKECAILKLLYEKKTEVVSRDQIIDDIWGVDSFPSSRTVDNYIVKLRKWCETDPAQHISIQTIRGIGYKLETKE
ncbi:MAG: response regulator transcription factor [Halobacteriovoraceae bacterium]|nr:response regulator transcription factor [Halobacteriovoraceae bacterium]MCB9095085.1 response regulator transcription factor [Halobacteriovoraceae bacterium]